MPTVKKDNTPTQEPGVSFISPTYETNPSPTAIDFSVVEEELLKSFGADESTEQTKSPTPTKKTKKNVKETVSSNPGEPVIRVPLSDYTPTPIVIDREGKICTHVGIVYTVDEQKILSPIVGSKLYSTGVTYVADLNCLDLSKFDPKTKSFQDHPEVPRLMDQLLDNNHPLCEGSFNPTSLDSTFTKIVEDKSKENSNHSDFSVTEMETPGVDRFCMIQPTTLLPTDFISTLNLRIQRYNSVNPRQPIKCIPLPSNNNPTLLGPETPLIESQEERERLLACSYSGLNTWSGGWVHDPPTMLEFEDNREMLEKIYKHCEDVPDFKILYLRKRYVCYSSDGSMDLTPDAINRPVDKRSVLTKVIGGIPQIEVIENTTSQGAPIIYCGEAWVIKFTVAGVNHMGSGRVVFATPDQFKNAFIKFRPDLVENFVPWSDYIFVCSTYCERNGSKNYHLGYDLSSPHQRRLSLALWILGPLAQRAISNGQPFPSIVNQNGYNMKDRLATLRAAQDVKNKAMADLEASIKDALGIKSEDKKPAAKKSTTKKTTTKSPTTKKATAKKSTSVKK